MKLGWVVKHQRGERKMSKKSKVSVGFRTTEDKNETPIENWDVYPTHLYMPKDYWTVSTTADEVKKKTKKKK
jgi:hypothetical protein